MKNKLLIYLKTISLLIFISLAGCSEDDETVLQPGDTNNTGNTGTDPDTSTPVAITPNDILSSQKYDKLVLEIQYAAGYQPPQGAVDNLKALMEARLDKPGGITIISTEIAAPGQQTYTADEIRTIEKENRTKFSEGSTLATYLFFADGGYDKDTENSKVLGIAYGRTSMALFQKTIEDYSGGLQQPSRTLLTSTVMNHEFGHILGLVNNGTPMEVDHQDTAHGRHCTVQECLMFWTAETNQGLDDLLGMSSPPDFDSQCLADLKANGGK